MLGYSTAVFLSLSIVLTLLAGLPTQAKAAFVEVANAVNDFASATVPAIGTASNPNVSWRYEGAETNGGTGDDNYFVFGTQRARGGVSPGWNGGNHNEDFEGIYLDLTGSFPNTLAMHPASIGGVDHNVRIGYVTQMSGAYQVVYSVLDSNDLNGQFGIGPFEISIRKGSALAADNLLTLIQGPTTVGEQFSNGTVNFSTPSFTANAGDVVYLIIDGAGNFSTDDSRITMSVQLEQLETVPEPSTLTLAVLGLLGLGFVALRKKNRRA